MSSLKHLDLKSVPCPLNVVKIKLALEKLSKNQQLIIELKNTEDIHVHPNITFYSFLIVFILAVAVNSVLYFKFIHPIASKSKIPKFNPGNSNKIELDIVKNRKTPTSIIVPICQ